ncbi:hypothetical protein TrVE_jg6951 [Triparma verrucosa]|uniref:Oxidation resistance protein 1 n=1 Tax=Triparma verrucosa TaxID=1606542 RepID=A0A9W7BH54_9STRA|nr:hypothetical protein TrVE_jg6951 [Triparma verrucosa]
MDWVHVSESSSVPPPPLLPPSSPDTFAPEIEPEDGTSAEFIMTQTIMKNLLENGLPLIHRFQKWKRLFSLLRDGCSFLSLLSKCASHRRTIILIQTTSLKTFGAYSTESWSNRPGPANFYGSGESFVFEIPTPSSLKMYKWTGCNNFFQLCDQDTSRIAIGGGGEGGEFAICVEDDFNRGTSGPTETYGNEMPLGGEGWFEVLNFEVYGFVS